MKFSLIRLDQLSPHASLIKSTRASNQANGLKRKERDETSEHQSNTALKSKGSSLYVTDCNSSSNNNNNNKRHRQLIVESELNCTFTRKEK